MLWNVVQSFDGCSKKRSLAHTCINMPLKLEKLQLKNKNATAEHEGTCPAPMQTRKASIVCKHWMLDLDITHKNTQINTVSKTANSNESMKYRNSCCSRTMAWNTCEEWQLKHGLKRYSIIWWVLKKVQLKCETLPLKNYSNLLEQEGTRQAHEACPWNALIICRHWWRVLTSPIKKHPNKRCKQKIEFQRSNAIWKVLLRWDNDFELFAKNTH